MRMSRNVWRNAIRISWICEYIYQLKERKEGLHMGVDWGEYLGTEDPYEIEDMLRDEGIREQERIQNGDYDEDDEEKHVKTLNDDDIPF